MHDYFGEIAAFVAVVVWQIRIEGRVAHHDKQLDALDKRLTDFDSKILAKLGEIAERLSFIEGSIRGSGKE